MTRSEMNNLKSWLSVLSALYSLRSHSSNIADPKSICFKTCFRGVTSNWDDLPTEYAAQ